MFFVGLKFWYFTLDFRCENWCWTSICHGQTKKSVSIRIKRPNIAFRLLTELVISFIIHPWYRVPSSLILSMFQSARNDSDEKRFYGKLICFFCLEYFGQTIHKTIIIAQPSGAANIVCMVSTDEPVQGYATSIVKNTQNPFWDEHFILWVFSLKQITGFNCCFFCFFLYCNLDRRLWESYLDDVGRIWSSVCCYWGFYDLIFNMWAF